MQSLNGVTYVRVAAHEEKERRKPNFTEAENLFLVEQFEKYKSILTSKVINSSTNKKKQRVWQLISNEINMRNPGVKRLPIDIKRKWKNMIRVASHDPSIMLQNVTTSETHESEFPGMSCTRAAINKRIFQIRQAGVSNTTPMSTSIPHTITTSYSPEMPEETDKDFVKAETLLEKAESDFYNKSSDADTHVFTGRGLKTSVTFDDQSSPVEVVDDLTSAKEEDDNLIITDDREEPVATVVSCHDDNSVGAVGSTSETVISEQPVAQKEDSPQTIVVIPRSSELVTVQDSPRPVPRVASVVSHALPQQPIPRTSRLNRPLHAGSMHQGSFAPIKRPQFTKSGFGLGRFVRQQYSPRYVPLHKRPYLDGHDDLLRFNREILEAEKEKIDLEKEKLQMEREKIKLENVKLGLEIELLRKQLYGEGYEDLQDEMDM